VIVPRDDSFTHQRVAPAVAVEHEDPRWAERCYHLLFCDEELMLCCGRQLYPHGGRRAAFLGVASAREQVSLRFAEPFAIGDDPDAPAVGPLRLEPRRPLHEWRLALDDDALPVGLDLAFESRLPPLEMRANRIERDGVLVTHYMNFFQSGHYAGTVAVDGRERRVERRAGFRDRGWGLRKHEGSPARGLVVFVACELPDACLHLLLYETASGRRVFTEGGLTCPQGPPAAVLGAAHELRFEDGLLVGGRIDVELADGARRLEIEVRNRLFLSRVGYSREGLAAGVERLDLGDPEARRAAAGQTDNGCAFRLDGAAGHGFVETGLGVHARYRPEP
jgi:hypothetical protein